MSKIDTSNWKRFHLYDKYLFTIFAGTKLDKRNMTIMSPAVNFVGRSNFNNGIADKVDELPNISPYPSGLLTLALGGSIGACFVQPEPFYTSQNVVVLKPNSEMSENVKFFISTMIFKEAQLYYRAFENELNRHVKREFSILLPIKPNNEPDWEYMETYIKRLKTRERESFLLVATTLKANNKKEIAIENWGRFALEELFDIVKGTRLTKANMRDGDYRFIGASAINNGLTHQIDNDEKLHPGNTLTVCYNGSVGEAFYQDKPFWASDDVNVLYPKFNMTKNIAFFFCTLLRQIGQAYAFVDKWRLEIMKKDQIRLPIDEMGQPDWDYMENYIKNIRNNVYSFINKI